MDVDSEDTSGVREPEAESALSAGSMCVGMGSRTESVLLPQTSVEGNQEEMNIDELTTKGEKSVRDVGAVIQVPSLKRKEKMSFLQTDCCLLIQPNG